MVDAKVFLDRRGVWAFGLGCVAVTIGVLLHLPMFWMGHNNGFVLAGMPMDPGMIFGMSPDHSGRWRSSLRSPAKKCGANCGGGLAYRSSCSRRCQTRPGPLEANGCAGGRISH